jgi:murein DD-endopeptidase MepM/ murein hydrolase activator NlpD
MRLAWALPLFFIVLTSLYAKPLAGPTEIKVYTADGFDYPVAKPNAVGYYKSRGWFKYHPGEDWVSTNRSALLGAPIYSIGIGVVVFTRNAPGGWGNVVIVRHAYYEEGRLYQIDSFYAHLNRVIVREGQCLAKGQQLGEVGTNRGMYPPHLHFEIRKNLLIGINRSGYQRNFNNYWFPTRFIEAHRKLRGEGHRISVPMGTFAFQAEFPFPIDESRIHPRKKKTEAQATPKKSFRVNRFEDLHSF